MNTNTTPHAFSYEPSGPFDLANQTRYFGGWPTLPNDERAIVMAFPLEASEQAVAVVIRQSEDGVIMGEVHGCREALVDRARSQALAAISLDTDGSGWTEVGRRDPVIGRLQAKYRHLRPTVFHSPYEAAAAFVIGHRISITQGRALRARIAAEVGTAITIEGKRFYAFPTPGQLLRADTLPGLNQIKTERLGAIARAAQEGWLAREPLRAMSEDAALAKLQTLPGIGAFFSQGILFRGAGTIDTLTNEEIGRYAVAQAYGLRSAPDQKTLEQIAEAWRPYRMWTVVLLHVWARNELVLPPRSDSRQRRANRPRPRPAPADHGVTIKKTALASAGARQ